MIELDGARLGGGQALRQSLTLSALSGQPFHLRQIRTGQPRPGLHPDQTAEVRAAALCCEARLVGAFDGSTDLRFEPGAPAAGEYHIELPGAASAAQVAQMLVPILAAAPEPSRVTIVGGTHVPRAPLHEAMAGPWLAGLAAVGLRASARLVGIGFHPAGGGQVALAVEGWTRPAAFDWGRRGELMSLRGVSVGSRLRGEVGQRQREGCARHLWEQRRLEVAWDVVTARSTSPGAYLHVEAVFEHSRASFGLLGQRGVAPEALGQRLARRILRFLDLEGALASDTFTAEQSLVPLALAGGGGRLTTPEIGLHLEQAVELLRLFGRAVRLTGRRGGPGEVEVDA